MYSASGVNEARKEFSHKVLGQWRTSHQHCCNMCDARHTNVPVLPSPALWGWLKSDSGGNHFGLNYQRRPLHATNLYIADARRAAGVSANAVRRIYCSQNDANVAEHVATTCSS